MVSSEPPAVFRVPAERTVFNVSAEIRTFGVPPESREFDSEEGLRPAPPPST